MTLMSMVKCAEREERMRRSYYPLRVAAGKMTEEQAAHEIGAMAAIANLLRCQLVEQHHPGAPHDPTKPLGQG